jgi:filamentous hemagglutinin
MPIWARFCYSFKLYKALDLFDNSISLRTKPNQRFTYDKDTNTLHRFFNDGNGVWHWSGSTNQGANSLTSRDVPNEIIRFFGLPSKGW